MLINILNNNHELLVKSILLSGKGCIGKNPYSYTVNFYNIIIKKHY